MKTQIEHPKDPPVNSGAMRIMAERLRQIRSEKYTAEHDDTHKPTELMQAAECYLLAVRAQVLGTKSLVLNYVERRKPPLGWPWEDADWKPSADPLRNLEKAGALIAAEIDRAARASAKPA